MDLECGPVAITGLLERSMTLVKEKCLKHGIRSPWTCGTRRGDQSDWMNERSGR